MNTTTEALRLLHELKSRGLELQPAGDRIRYRPIEAMTPELAEQVKARKAEILALLASPPIEPAPEQQAENRCEVIDWNDLDPDWRLEFEERAAIREYDGGQAREHAEAAALREVLEAMRQAGVINLCNLRK